MKSLRLFWLVVPLLNTAQQFFLKRGAQTTDETLPHWLVATLTSPWFLAAIAAEVICFVVWMRVLAELDLSKAFPLSALSYVFVMALAWFAFGETLSLLTVSGSVLILGGVFLIAAPGARG